jgi:hypothetical protein
VVLELDAVAARAFVGERDLQAAGQERGLAQALLEDREVEVQRLEDLGVGQEADRRPRLLRGLALAQVIAGHAAVVLLREDVAVAADLNLQRLAQRVDDRDADAVQATGDLVAAAVAELAAGVQDGQHDLDRRALLLLHHPDGDAGAVIDDRDRVVGMDGDVDLRGAAGQCLVDRVVDDLVDEVVQTAEARRPDVHARPLADCLEALEDGDVLGVVVGLSLPAVLGFWVLRQHASVDVKSPGSGLAASGPGLEQLVDTMIAHRGPLPPP